MEGEPAVETKKRWSDREKPKSWDNSVAAQSDTQWKNSVFTLAAIYLTLVPQFVRMGSPFPFVVYLTLTCILLGSFIICTGGSVAPRGLWQDQSLQGDAEGN